MIAFMRVMTILSMGHDECKNIVGHIWLQFPHSLSGAHGRAIFTKSCYAPILLLLCENIIMVAKIISWYFIQIKTL